MATWLMLLVFSGVLLGLCLAALGLRTRLGLAPLMLTLGVLEGMKTFVIAGVSMDLPGLGPVNLGSMVSYMVALTVVQVLYLRCGLAAARQLAWTLLVVSVVLAVITPMAAWLVGHQRTVEVPALQLAQLARSGYVQAVGNLLLLVGLLGGVVLLNAFQQRRLPVLLGLPLSLLVVSAVDTLLFQGLAFGASALASVPTVAAAKGAMALWLSLLAALYLRWREDWSALDAKLPAAGELLAVLSFRGRMAEMERELLTDPLTGLFNRRYLEQAVPDLLSLNRLRGLPTSLVLIDLDHFKQLNDTHGHLVGDQALLHTAACLRDGLRRHDAVVRFGGEEFLLVLPGADALEAQAVAQKALEQLRARPLEGSSAGPLRLTASAGVASAPSDGLSLRPLLQQADERLYAAKAQGRDRVVGAA